MTTVTVAGVPLVLASASPRRRALLDQIAVPHWVQPANIDESRLPGEPAQDYVGRLARGKARTVAALCPGVTVLAADTTVALGGAILNKPRDRAEAGEMLRSLAGRTHVVHTGIALVWPAGERTHVETTAVTFSAIPERELSFYLDTGDSLDKAGAYGIQGYAARWISGIQGDYFNVVGLPLAAVARLLRETGYGAAV